MAETFGPYRLEGLLGRGGMGEVYRAADTRKNDRLVALKRLPAELGDPQFAERFRREAHAAASLRSPHIVPVHDYGEIDGRLFLDMALIDGEDLATVLRRSGPLAARRAVAILAQAASALDTAHQAGLVHRDVKPANVLLLPQDTEAGEEADFVYLVDFGIARDVASTGLTSTGTTIGTMSYLAPERFADPQHADARVDVYALGCVLFEMLTGRPPFEAEDTPSLMYAHLTLPPPAPSRWRSDLPRALDDVVARAMAKDATHRHAGAGELARHARSVLGGALPVRASAQPTVTPRAVPPMPPARAVVGSAVPTPGIAAPPAGPSPGPPEPSRAAAIADGAALVVCVAPIALTIAWATGTADAGLGATLVVATVAAGLVATGVRALGPDRTWRTTLLHGVAAAVGVDLVVADDKAVPVVAGWLLLAVVVLGLALSTVARRTVVGDLVAAAGLAAVSAEATVAHLSVIDVFEAVTDAGVGALVGLVVGVGLAVVRLRAEGPDPVGWLAPGVAAAGAGAAAVLVGTPLSSLRGVFEAEAAIAVAVVVAALVSVVFGVVAAQARRRAGP